MFERYHNAVSYVEALSNALPIPHPSFFPEKMQYFLDSLGNPEKGFKYIHVTGTGGKGTVASMLHSGLVAEGKKAGLFTSPYVTTAIEEIKVEELYISPDEYTEIVDYLKPYAEKMALNKKYGNPTAFMMRFALALIYFKRQKCEWAVIEVGIGGRYDFTNVIPNPKATVITHIDYDHTNFLGTSLRQIAWDKAGIIKKNSLFFTTEKRSVLREIFKDICRKEGASYHAVEYGSGEDGNKILAGAVLQALGVSDGSIQKGIERLRMPARFEIMNEEPYIILDGAHNRSKMRNTVDRLKTLHFEKLFALVAISNLRKDNTAIFAELLPSVDTLILTTFTGTDRKSIHPNALLDLVKSHLKKGAKLEIILDPQDALATALKEASKDDCVLATGSFFLAGELRKKWFSENDILKERKSFA